MRSNSKLASLIHRASKSDLDALRDYFSLIEDDRMLGIVEDEIYARAVPDEFIDVPYDTPSLEDMGLELGSYAS